MWIINGFVFGELCLFCSVIKDTHILFVNSTVVCGSCQGSIPLFLLFWKGTLDLIWHVGCRGPVSLTVWRVHSQCPRWRKTKQVEKELFPLEKHQGDYFCSFKLLKRELGQRKGGGLVFSCEQQTVSRARSVMRSSGLGAGWTLGRGAPGEEVPSLGSFRHPVLECHWPGPGLLHATCRL